MTTYLEGTYLGNVMEYMSFFMSSLWVIPTELFKTGTTIGVFSSIDCLNRIYLLS